MKLHQWIKVCRKIICGIKRIVSFLTEELVQRGHDVTMSASGGIPDLWPPCWGDFMALQIL